MRVLAVSGCLAKTSYACKMIVSLRYFLGWLVSGFRSREDLVLENLALRRQLLALHAQQPRRRLGPFQYMIPAMNDLEQSSIKLPCTSSSGLGTPSPLYS